MPITSLHFTNVGPFEDADFAFDEHVNVFTGPNNSGKSSVLWVLGETLTFPFAFPEKLLRKAEANFKINIRKGTEVDQLKGTVPMSGGIFSLPMVEMFSALRRWNDVLEGIGYTSFVPALRRSTDYRSEGPSVNRHDEADSRLMRKIDPERLKSIDPKLI
jgi:hypothetical protein